MIADKFVAEDEPPFGILKIEALGRTNLFRFGIPDKKLVKGSSLILLSYFQE